MRSCPKLLPKNARPHHFRCQSCQKAFRLENPYPEKGNTKSNLSKIKNQNKDKNKEKTKDNKQETNVALVMSLTTDKIKNQNKWYLDSGSTTHVASNNNNFTNISKSDQLIQGPSGEIAPATLKGDSLFSTTNGNILFKDILIVPKLKRNLLSVKRITASSPDISILFQGTNFEIFKGKINKGSSTSILQGQIDESGLYAVSNQIEESISNSDLSPTKKMVQLHNLFENEENENDPPPIEVNVARTLQQWHECLTHINKKSILQLRDTTKDFQVTDPESTISCQSCDAAKMSRKKFAKVMPDHVEKAGQAIYSDICGKISPPTFQQEKYVIHFLDEQSGFLWVYLAQKKS